MKSSAPKLVILDPNTLAALGLKQLLQSLMPFAEIEIYGTMAELQANHPEQFYHFFVAMTLVLENRTFFTQYKRQTIVLTTADSDRQLAEFHCLPVNVPEKELVRSLLALAQMAHGNGQHLPPLPRNVETPLLTDREAEVMVLIVQGFINKEIANRLNIAPSTVITHRKNIMEKLGLKSVSALTIYAVMHGYVNINKI